MNEVLTTEIRKDALSMALDFHKLGKADPEMVLKTAAKFEQYLSGGRITDDPSSSPRRIGDEQPT